VEFAQLTINDTIPELLKVLPDGRAFACVMSKDHVPHKMKLGCPVRLFLAASRAGTRLLARVLEAFSQHGGKIAEGLLRQRIPPRLDVQTRMPTQGNEPRSNTFGSLGQPGICESAQRGLGVVFAHETQGLDEHPSTLRPEPHLLVPQLEQVVQDLVPS
jgi:hypothetical protein